MASTLTEAPPAYLSTSLSCLSSSRSASSLVTRTYKAATTLYLTKRFAEALETLLPIITPPPATSSSDHESSTNGDSIAAPIAQASRSTRTKVWVFYLSLLHAIIELGTEEGKRMFGVARWRELCAKASSGSIWAEITTAGYGGNESEIDAEVVVNLATLLLGHMQSQRLTQTRLETWLATSGSDGSMKDLERRLKVIELYALHVLPTNEEWELARGFLEASDVLDEERREMFLRALDEVKGEKDGSAELERERLLEEQRARERKEREAEAENERVKKEAERADAAKVVEEERRNREKASRNVADKPTHTGTLKPTPTSPPKANRTTKPPSRPRPPPQTLYLRASSALHDLQSAILSASRTMTGSNTALLRLLMFIAAFLTLMARRDLRVRLRRVLEGGWAKVKGTVGMGVKVSYI